MKREAYYNEFDPKAAAWLRALIDKGLIAKGVVDERSILEVTPDDLEGYLQCHFFAGIGVWSYALRCAGWPDDRPVWTGSCPCQPFSAAGKGIGFADERHLWPAWHWLIDQCRPPIVFGEQVASKDGLAWLDLVSSDLEGSGYTFGAADLCAAGVGAPHIRQRLYFVADADDTRSQRWPGVPERPNQRLVGSSGMASRLGDTERRLPGWRPGEALGAQGGAGRVEEPGDHGPLDAGESVLVGMADAHNPERGPDAARGDDSGGQDTGRAQGAGDAQGRGRDGRPGPTNGFWRDADWLYCRDGKWRPVEPGTFPLADGAPARVGRLRGYGNAIERNTATTFIQTVMEVTNAY